MYNINEMVNKKNRLKSKDNNKTPTSAQRMPKKCSPRAYSAVNDPWYTFDTSNSQKLCHRDICRPVKIVLDNTIYSPS